MDGLLLTVWLSVWTIKLQRRSTDVFYSPWSSPCDTCQQHLVVSLVPDRLAITWWAVDAKSRGWTRTTGADCISQGRVFFQACVQTLYLYLYQSMYSCWHTHTHRLVCESGSYPVLVNIVLAVVYQLMFPPDPVTVCEPADTSSAAGMDPAQQAGLLQASSKAPESVASLDDLTTDTNK